jgi:hypothetical protein
METGGFIIKKLPNTSILKNINCAKKCNLNFKKIKEQSKSYEVYIMQLK